MPGSRPHSLLGQELRFLHAVNSRRRLSAFLGSKTEVAEADVVFGLHRGGGQGGSRRLRVGAVLAHPPKRWSDLSLEEFLLRARDGDRVVKIDFKSQRALDVGLPMARQHERPTQTMLNIDCVRGPGGALPNFRPEDLERMARAVPGALISIGATTRRRSGAYTTKQIDALIDAAESTTAPLTVAIRAEPALSDPKRIEPLLDRGIKLTLWNSRWSNPTTERLRRALQQAWPEAWLDLAG